MLLLASWDTPGPKVALFLLFWSEMLLGTMKPLLCYSVMF